ncbi:hypothetical protein [Paraburkholderia guartelaensis]|uniref:hypothetical protein n=1 Tax=Paraburkholderia guartelaensis TaxID=2546446 RepID=UPI002AB74002|nr:hypothetical protein [Paraburkholderia guartelaensis]
MFRNISETYLDLMGDRTRVETSRVTQTLFMKDRLGSQLLVITQRGKPQAVFPATDRNIEVILCAGLRIHEYVMLDGQIDYQELAESRDHFEDAAEGIAFEAAHAWPL